jgi:hypothetical protein
MRYLRPDLPKINPEWRDERRRNMSRSKKRFPALGVLLPASILFCAAQSLLGEGPTNTPTAAVPCEKCVGQKPDSHAIDIDAKGNANKGKECVRVSKGANNHIVWSVDPTIWTMIELNQGSKKCPFTTCQIKCDSGGHCDSGKVVVESYGCFQYRAVSKTSTKTGTDPEVTIDP